MVCEVVQCLKLGEFFLLDLIDVVEVWIVEVELFINVLFMLCLDCVWVDVNCLMMGIGSEVQYKVGWLVGFLIVIKDFMDVVGVCIIYGFLIFVNYVFERLYFLVEWIEYMGGIVLGKLNILEFGVGGFIFNEVFGKICNLWNIFLIFVGFIGGGVVVLVLGEVWLVYGSDYGGSFR